MLHLCYFCVGLLNTNQLQPRDNALPIHAIARLGTNELSHVGPIRSLTFSRDDCFLMTTESERTLVWDLRQSKGQKERATVIDLPKIGRGENLGAWFLANDSEIIVCDEYYDHRLSNWNNGVNRTSKKYGARAICGISADRDLIGVGFQSGRIGVFHAQSGQSLGIDLKTEGGSTALAFDRGKKLLATGDFNGNVAIWDFRTGKRLQQLQNSESEIVSIVFSPDGQKLIVADDFDSIQIWQLDPRRKQQRFAFRGPTSMALTPCGRYLAVGGLYQDIAVYDLDANKVIRELKGHIDEISCLSFSSDGSVLASGSKDQTVILWDWKSGKIQYPRGGHRGTIHEITFAPDGQTIVARTGNSAELIRWRLDGTIKQVVPEHASIGDIRPLYHAVARSGSLVAALGQKDVVSIRNAQSFKELRRVSIKDMIVKCLAINADRGLLAVAGGTSNGPDLVIGLFDAKSGARIGEIATDRQLISSLTFSHDGTLLAVRDPGQTAIWDVKSRKRVTVLGVGTTLTGPPVIFGPLSRWFVINNPAKASAELRDTKTGALIRTIAGAASGNFVGTIAMSSDGQLLATSWLDGKIALWDVPTGKLLARLGAHTGAVQSMAFSDDGSRLATGSDDTTILVWDVHTAIRDFKGQ